MDLNEAPTDEGDTMFKMRPRKLRSLLIMSLAAVALLSACAKSSTPSSGGSTPPPSSAAAGSLKIASSDVSGVGTVLVNDAGFTLYHLKTETPGKIVCTGSCVGVWPPVLLPAGVMAAHAGTGLPGTLGTIHRPDGGTQVTYNGFPLYTYSGDTAAGQANGQGIQGVWFAVTSTGGGATPPSASGSSGGGTGYGY